MNNPAAANLANLIGVSAIQGIPSDVASIRSYQPPMNDAGHLKRRRDFEDVSSMRSGGSGQGLVGYCGMHDLMDRSITSLNPHQGYNSNQMAGFQPMLFHNPQIQQSHQSLASSNASKMTMLSNKVMAEAYQAAAKAASEALLRASLHMESGSESAQEMANNGRSSVTSSIGERRPPEMPPAYGGSWHRKSNADRKR
ncbi:hypothetical protein Ciccas_014275, partial [Cichlidogyrus casuarinus]